MFSTTKTHIVFAKNINLLDYIGNDFVKFIMLRIARP